MLHPMVYMDADWNGFQNMIKAKDCLPMIIAPLQKGGKMADYIDRQALLNDIEQYHLSDGKFQHWVEVQPSADVQPVRHGRWMEENRRPRSAMFYCSECHRTAYDIQPTRDKTWAKRCRYAYCPNCGARMDGET